MRVVIAMKQRPWELERALRDRGARVTWIDDVAKGLRAEKEAFELALIDSNTRSLSLDWATAELKRRVPDVRILTVQSITDVATFARELFGVAPPRLDFEELGGRERWDPLFAVSAKLDGKRVEIAGTEDPECFERFDSLAVLLASIPPSPFITSMVKLGRDDERAWAAFPPRPAGASLHSYLRLLGHEGRGLSAAAVSWLGLSCCSTLELLHAHHTRHGYARPQALWISDDGESVLRFPSIGVLIEGDRVVQRRGMGLAPRRDDLAPETLRHQPQSNATDVFQLGHLLFEAATTHKAFRDWPHDRELPRIPLPSDLQEIIAAMLEAEPTARPAVHEVSAVLRRHVDEAGARSELLEARRRLRELLAV